MIIECISQAKNTINAIFYKNGNIVTPSSYMLSDAFNKSQPSFLDEPLELVMADPTVTEVDIIIQFPNNIFFQGLNYDFIASTIPKVILSMSYDGISWKEFPYFMIPGGLTSTDLPTMQVINMLKNKLIKQIDGFNMIYDTFIPPVLLSLTPPQSIIANRIISLLTQKEYGYLWNENGATVNLFNEFNFIKLTLTDFVVTPVPLSLNTLTVSAAVIIDNISYIDYSTFNDNLFKYRFFTDYPFIPSVCNTMLQMINTAS
jgi:hypothetical protein